MSSETEKTTTEEMVEKVAVVADEATKSDKADKAAKKTPKDKKSEKKDGVVYRTLEDDDIPTTTVDELAKESKGESKVKADADAESSKKDKKASNRNSAKAKKRMKKLRRWLIIIAIVAAALFLIVKYAQFSAKKILEGVSSVTTIDQVSKMDLASTISTTGTIQSKDVRTLTSALAGVTIEAVNYEVGDMVQEGAVVVAFSREDINKKIDNLQEDINEASAAKGLDAGSRNADHDYGYGTENYNIANAGVRTANAQADLNNAYTDLSKAQQDKADYKAKYDEAIQNKDSVHEELEEVQRLFKVWQAAFKSPANSMAGEAEEFPEYAFGDDIYKIANYYYYLTTVDMWNDKITELQKQYNEYETTIQSYDSQIASYDRSITSAERTVENAQRSYDSALSLQAEQLRTSANNLQKYDYNLAKGNLTSNDAVNNYKRQLEEYVDRLDDYVVYAPITGLVTEVNAQEGNGYQATTGALMTIQAVDIYEVSTQVDEYDITNVKLGQKVIIMTEATGDEELEGVVSFIAPTATPITAGATSSAVTYKVNIDITSKNDKLMLGMSAKLNIITEEHKDILAVRYDAIEEDEQGNKVVYVVSDEDAKANQKKEDKTADGIAIVGMGDNKASNGNSTTPADKKEEQTFLQFLIHGDDLEEAAGGLNLKNAAKKVVVDIGIEGDYYTEVKARELTDGTNVLVNNKNGALNDMMLMFNGMGGGPGGM